MNNQSNWALVVSSLVLGLAVVGGSFLVGSAIDQSGTEIAEILGEIRDTASPAPTRNVKATPPPRNNRPDPNRRYDVITAGSPARGPEKARIHIVEFSDFQCPFCARVYPTIQRIEEEYGDDVRIVFKHLPLRIHPQAPDAHAAAEAAHQQGNFWPMHDLIIANPRSLSKERYLAYAEQIGLDVEKFTKDYASSRIRGRVEADTAEASTLGVTGTPAFFINGRFLSGAQPFESFKRVIDEELAKTG